MSQLQLETAIGASPGTVSRIESGKVNPTKETILSVTKTLNLTDFDIASLFSIKFNSTLNFLETVNSFSTHLEIDSIIQTAIDELTERFDYTFIAVALLNKNEICGAYCSRNTISNIVNKLIGDFTKLSISLTKYPQNLMIRSALENRVFQSNNSYDFTIGSMSKKIAQISAKVMNKRCSIAVPLRFNSKPLGSIYFVRGRTEDYTDEIPILNAVAKQISIQVFIGKLVNRLIQENEDMRKECEHQKLKEELKNLSTKIQP